MPGLLTLAYLIGSITFIVGLKMLSNPATARKGNLIAAGGMFIAIIGTIFLYEEGGERLHNYGWIFGGLWYAGLQATLGFEAGYTVNFVTIISLYSIATVLYWVWFRAVDRRVLAARAAA